MRNCYTHSFVKGILTLTMVMFVCMCKINAQTTLTTLPNPPYNASNGAGTNTAVTFVVENTNSFPILLNNVSAWLNTTDANSTLQLWYSATSTSGLPAIATPTWTQINQVTNFAAPATSGITPIWTGLGFVIPANTEYRFAVWYVNIGSHYSGTGIGTVTPSTFSGGGVNFKVGDVQIGGQNVGYGGPNNPRWFTGEITFQPAGPCTNPPTPGTVVSTVNPSCSGLPFTLSLTGGNGGTGQTYQWQIATAASGPWTNIPSASSATLTTTQTANNYYRCQVTCGVTVSSTSLLVSSTVCAPVYCAPTYTSGTGSGDYCTLVQIPTTTLNNATGASASPYYTLYPKSGASTCTLIPGQSYSIVLSAGTYTSNDFAVWIDYNQNGILETTELVGQALNTPAGPATTTLNFTVPINATAGSARLRVREADQASTTMDPCISYTFGEVEDYDITIASLVPCAGTPVAGTTTASQTNIVCAGTPITLGLNGNTIASGITYQWQSSIDNITWADITGANSLTFTTTQTATSMYYRCVVTCTNGGASSNSTSIQVTSVSGPVYAPIPYTESFENTWINGCGTRDIPNQYWKNTPITGNTSWRRNDDGVAGAAWASNNGAYTPAASDGVFSARFHSYDAASASSGTFDLYLNCNTPDLTKRLEFDVINISGNDSISIQLSTNGGVTFNRLDSTRLATAWRTKTIFFNSTSPTTIIRFKATGDFGVSDIGIDNIKINNFPNCTGTPVAGTATSTQTNIICPGSQFTLSLTGSTVAGGLTYQWQSSTTATGTFTNISGATSLLYTTTQSVASLYYQCIVTCSVGGASSTSTSIQVTAVPTVYAAIPYTESFENTWINGCGTRDIPNQFWKNTPLTGNASWRRNDDGVAGAAWASNNGAYAPAATDGIFSARFHSYDVPSSTTGSFDLYLNCNTPDLTKKLDFDYINTSGNDSVSIQISTDGGVTFTRLDSFKTITVWKTKTIFFNSTSATSVIRFKAIGDF
ncbi:MAG: hypothetical protein H7178_08460, partial [Chitinophagaceae bacterium]|nr:hypothetical protein [Chitinophagaceae bacterium]